MTWRAAAVPEVQGEGEKDGKAEHLLSHIEGNAARAIKNILNPVFPLFPPQPQDRVDLCLFLAFQKVRGKLTRKRIEMLGDLWAHLQIPADMTPEQARAWLQAHEHEVTPESVQEMVELSAAMEDFEFAPDLNAHLGAMGGIALRISELLLPRPWWITEYDSPALLTSDEPVGVDRSIEVLLRCGFPDSRGPPGRCAPIDRRDLHTLVGEPGHPVVTRADARIRVSRQPALARNRSRSRICTGNRRTRTAIAAPRRTGRAGGTRSGSRAGHSPRCCRSTGSAGHGRRAKLARAQRCR
jgi:hypothetical protein